MAEKNLELYIKNGCPYCHKVLAFMDANGIELPLHNIDESDADRERLVEVGGKRQVPCLFIDGKAMYESDDIIAYLGKEFLGGGSWREGRRPRCGCLVHHWRWLLVLVPRRT